MNCGGIDCAGIYRQYQSSESNICDSPNQLIKFGFFFVFLLLSYVLRVEKTKGIQTKYCVCVCVW